MLITKFSKTFYKVYSWLTRHLDLVARRASSMSSSSRVLIQMGRINKV